MPLGIPSLFIYNGECSRHGNYLQADTKLKSLWSINSSTQSSIVAQKPGLQSRDCDDGDVVIHLFLARGRHCTQRPRVVCVLRGCYREQAIGKAAPWFILAIMLFAYAVRSMYIESCSMFVRGGVYRVVKEAMGSTLAKFSVSALMFDYILTGPISGVSAGQYLTGFLNDLFARSHVNLTLPINSTSAVFAIA